MYGRELIVLPTIGTAEEYDLHWEILKELVDFACVCSRSESFRL